LRDFDTENICYSILQKIERYNYKYIEHNRDCDLIKLSCY